MNKTILISLISLILGFALALFGSNLIDTKLTDSLPVELTETNLSRDFSTVLLASSALIELEENDNMNEAITILSNAQHIYVLELFHEHHNASKQWAQKVDALLLDYITKRKEQDKFNPEANELDKMISNHLEKHNKSLKQTD